jgi:hypothetical protein
MNSGPDDNEKYAERYKVQDLASAIDDARLEIKSSLPASRAASLAMTKLEEAVFWLKDSVEPKD